MSLLEAMSIHRSFCPHRDFKNAALMHETQKNNENEQKSMQSSHVCIHKITTISIRGCVAHDSFAKNLAITYENNAIKDTSLAYLFTHVEIKP